MPTGKGGKARGRGGGQRGKADAASITDPFSSNWVYAGIALAVAVAIAEARPPPITIKSNCSGIPQDLSE